MIRDGAFKVRTDLLADKVGKTDNWLMAANFTSSIPSSLNPFGQVPFPVSFKVFGDVGTYAEAWKKDANVDRFLFDAGLQLSLLKDHISFYLPLIYSKVYSDYIKSTIDKKGRMWKKISFSVNIAGLSPKKLTKDLGL